MKTIPLTQGKLAIVDDDSVMDNYKWYVTGRYAARRENGRVVYMHRKILGVIPGQEVDHVNGNGLDNRISNLRICSRSQNIMNRKKYGSHERKYKGTHKKHGNRMKPWYALITVLGKTHYLGHYATEEEAAVAYDAAAIRLHGQYAHLNFPL